MKPYHYFTRPNNMAYHNLCLDATPPAGIASLLGLGLKFCIESPRPNQSIDASIVRFQRSIRLHFHFAALNKQAKEDDDATSTSTDEEAPVTYIPKLYIPSTWEPPPSTCDEVEFAISKFDMKLNAMRKALPSHRRHNLSPAQRNVISELRNRNDLIIYPTDKNLGPSVSDRSSYIRDVLETHLLNDENYEYLPLEVATRELQKQRSNFIQLHQDLGHQLPTEAEETYFKRALHPSRLSKTRVPQIYGIYKVHKKEIKPRPVISSVNSIPEIFSKHVDYWLKKIVGTLLPTYIKDAEHLIHSLQETFPNGLPPGAKLFSVDAVGMYSNIDTDHGITILTRWLKDYRHELPTSMPTDFILASLTEIMKNNIFQFGDTCWRQKRGCAMGTSSAVNYACLYVGLLEVKRLLPRYRKQLLFFKRFIDDGIGVWLDTRDDPLAWRSFFRCLNNWGSLKWTCDGHVSDLVFLDLTISITPDRQIHFRSYQKPMNLYLYLPPGSAHPKNMLYSLIYGRLRAYRIRNTDTSDFIEMAKLLAQRLIARGFSLETLKPVFQRATLRLAKSDPRVKNNRDVLEVAAESTETAEPIIFHLRHHPRGITRQQVRTAYNEILQPFLTERRLLIAVSRPKNLKDRICSTVLPRNNGDNPSDYIDTGDNNRSPQILPRR
jgi:hypothetical protein